jgi:hypothetical protein
MGASLLIAAAAFLLPGTIDHADMLTGRSIAAAYISGELDPRIEELGTDAQTGEKKPEKKQTQNGGLKRHCRFLMDSRATSASGCMEAFVRNGGRND